MDARAPARPRDYGDATVKCPCCGQWLPLFAQLTLNRFEHLALRNGRAAQLTPTEFHILRILVNARGTLDRRSLAQRVYADRLNGGPESDKTLLVHISSIRRKLAPLAIEIQKNRRYAVVLR